jgi:hypothetical protein
MIRGNMPQPPVAQHMQRFEAGAVTIGIEYRIINDALVAATGKKPAPELGSIDDGGVAIHVFVKGPDGDLERLRFDCFANDPHYHYISWKNTHNDHVFIDPAVHSDVLAWSLNMIRTRLVQMLGKADIDNAAQYVDQERIEKVMPLVTAAAYGAQCNSDREDIAKAAFADVERLRAQ